MARREITDEDRPQVAEFIERHWHSKMIMSGGKRYYPHQEQGLIEYADGKIVALMTFHIDEDGVELLTLNSTLKGQGVGTSMILDANDIARRNGCTRIWLTTTNDNLHAIGFYQRLGYRMTTINVGAVDEARKIKPEIPEVGERGIPIHDEIVMELELQPYTDG